MIPQLLNLRFNLFKAQYFPSLSLYLSPNFKTTLLILFNDYLQLHLVRQTRELGHIRVFQNDCPNMKAHKKRSSFTHSSHKTFYHKAQNFLLTKLKLNGSREEVFLFAQIISRTQPLFIIKRKMRKTFLCFSSRPHDCHLAKSATFI